MLTSNEMLINVIFKGVSECFQADKTTLADVGRRVEFAIENITNRAELWKA